MPLKSKAQMKKFGAMVKEGKMSQEEFDKWIKDTPNINDLPERAVQPTGLDRLKAAAKVKIK